MSDAGTASTNPNTGELERPEVVTAEIMPRQTQALAVRQPTGAVSTQRMSVEELKENLAYIKEVMQTVMQEGQDYGTVPGCGTKPSLLQPGAQKLCMTFQLQDKVKKEEWRPIAHPTIAGHREYEFTLVLTSATGREWEGVGTCSTMETKYRYRKAERRCPSCGTNHIIQGKAEYGGGWICFRKKGGCGAKFAEDDERITGQPAGDVEYENPADYYNTVRKMAFKRAHVHATIIATNTSELWTQDVEDMSGIGDNQPPPRSAGKPPGRAAATLPPQQSAAAPVKPATATQPPASPPPMPTDESRTKMIKELKAGPDGINRQTVTEYFKKLTDPTPLAPWEDIEKLRLRFVPATRGQMNALLDKIDHFSRGDPAEHAFPPHTNVPDDVPGVKTATQVAPKVAAEATTKAKDPLWWRPIIISIPRKGMKRDAYLKEPDTIGALYDARHGNDEEAETARRRLFGLQEWKPEPREYKGKTYHPTEADHKTYDALQAFYVWFKANHPDEKLL